MPTYAANSTTAPYLAPLDPDEVLSYEFDWQPSAADLPSGATAWLESGDTIVASTWTVPAGLAAGDGSTVVTTEAGNVTPDAPTIIDSSTKTRVWLYVNGADPGEYEIENTVRTANGIVGSRSGKIVVGSK